MGSWGLKLFDLWLVDFMFHVNGHDSDNKLFKHESYDYKAVTSDKEHLITECMKCREIGIMDLVYLFV